MERRGRVVLLEEWVNVSVVVRRRSSETHTTMEVSVVLPRRRGEGVQRRLLRLRLSR